MSLLTPALVRAPARNRLPREKYEHMQNTTAAVGHAAYFASGRCNTTVLW
jgi:hypothetical protein